MAATSWKKSPSDLIERFSVALPERPGLVRKPMFGYPSAFLNGNLACGLFQDFVVARLGKEAAAQLVACGEAQPFEPMPGRTMGGYRPRRLRDREELCQARRQRHWGQHPVW